jgi:hypothetical protein
MPYIPDEEEQARIDAYKAERAERERPMREAFDNLTSEQQNVVRFVVATLIDFDDEMRDLEGDCYHSTMQKVRTVGYKLRSAFPSLRGED